MALINPSGEGRSLGSSRHAELREQRRNVVLDRLLGQEQLVGDLAVRMALSDQVEDAMLLRCEVDQPTLITVLQPLHSEANLSAVKQLGACSDLADRVDQVVSANLFQHVPRSTGHGRIDECLIVGERGEDQASNRRVIGSDLTADLDAVTITKANIEYGDIRHDSPHHVECLGERTGFTDDRHVGFRVDEIADALPDDLVIIKKKHTDRSIISSPRHHGETLFHEWGTFTPVAAILGADAARERRARSD